MESACFEDSHKTCNDSSEVVNHTFEAPEAPYINNRAFYLKHCNTALTWELALQGKLQVQVV